MRLAIYGSGGLGREVCFLAETVMRHFSPYSELLWIDDTKPAGYFCSRAMCPFDDFAEKYSPEDTHVVIAVGEPAQRKILAEKIAAAHYRLGRLISPDLQQSSDIEIMKCLANMTCGYGIIMVKMCIKSTGEHVTADKR